MRERDRTMFCYLITTVHNKNARWNYIYDQMEGVNLPFLPILATDYRLFQYAGLTEQQAKHQSLTLAYLQAAQTSIFHPRRSKYLVIEDDILFGSGFDDEYDNLMQNLPEDWDFLYGTKTDHNKEAAKTIPVNDYICKIVDNQWETPITFWNWRMIVTFNERMMAKLNEDILLGHIDHEILKICQEGNLNFYGATRNIANGLSTARHLADETISFEGSIS